MASIYGSEEGSRRADGHLFVPLQIGCDPSHPPARFDRARETGRSISCLSMIADRSRAASSSICRSERRGR
jgi:hypothetical protein